MIKEKVNKRQNENTKKTKLHKKCNGIFNFLVENMLDSPANPRFQFRFYQN